MLAYDCSGWDCSGGAVPEPPQRESRVAWEHSDRGTGAQGQADPQSQKTEAPPLHLMAHPFPQTLRENSQTRCTQPGSGQLPRSYSLTASMRYGTRRRFTINPGVSCQRREKNSREMKFPWTLSFVKSPDHSFSPWTVTHIYQAIHFQNVLRYQDSLTSISHDSLSNNYSTPEAPTARTLK